MKSIKLETSKKFKHYGEKIKSLVFHPEKPLLAAAHYNGKLSVFNYDSQSIVKTLEISPKPLRCVIWLSHDRLLTAGDDLKIKIFNFHTTEKLAEFEGHKDFLRKVIYNPTNNYLISCSDDKTIIHWTGEKGSFVKEQIWTEHRHFVMDVRLNPHEEGLFASASLDGSIKLWNLKSSNSNGTLKGHKSGVNAISYYNGDRPLLLSGGDDYQVIVWDLSSKSVLRKLTHHENNVVDVSFMSKLPLFSSISEDGKVNFYSLKNFEFCFDMVNFMNKGWSLSAKNNVLAAGYDEGCVVVQVGNDLPSVSSVKGKMIFAKNNEVCSLNLKAVIAKRYGNLDNMDVEFKELGNLEIFPTKLKHNENGQLVAFVDSNEYTIYKSLSFKQVLFGNCKDFVWGKNSCFAVLDKLNEISIVNSNGELIKPLKFDFYITEIFGGSYLGISNGDFILFYDWEGKNCIGKIDVEVKDVYWNKDRFVIRGPQVVYMLRIDENGEEGVFDLEHEITDNIANAYWQNDLFFYMTDTFKFKVVVMGKSFNLASFNERNVILDYLDNHQRFFFFDNNINVKSFGVSKQLLKILKSINPLKEITEEFSAKLPAMAKSLGESEKDFLANFLQQNNCLESAYKIVANTRTKFDLGIKLGYLEQTIKFCEELGESIYWKKLGDLALITGDFDIAKKAFISCKDTNSLLLLASCLGDKELLKTVAEMSYESKHYSVAFLAFWLSNDLKGCLDTLVDSERFGNAVIFAKTYCPSHIRPVFDKWRIYLKKKNDQLLLKKIVNPMDYPDQYGELFFLEQIEKVVDNVFSNTDIPASNYCAFKEELDGLDFYSTAKEEGVEVLERKLNEVVERHREVKFEEPDDISEIERDPVEEETNQEQTDQGDQQETNEEQINQEDEEETNEGWGDIDIEDD